MSSNHYVTGTAAGGNAVTWSRCAYCGTGLAARGARVHLVSALGRALAGLCADCVRAHVGRACEARLGTCGVCDALTT